MTLGLLSSVWIGLGGSVEEGVSFLAALDFMSFGPRGALGGGLLLEVGVAWPMFFSFCAAAGRIRGSLLTLLSRAESAAGLVFAGPGSSAGTNNGENSSADDVGLLIRRLLFQPSFGVDAAFVDWPLQDSLAMSCLVSHLPNPAYLCPNMGV